ncbi:hypothetical protein KO507_00130 [Gilvimarinus agarilyticus]|uniref:hypothetical protein n=1 Tax=Reichenbachiella agariperforans TaxID=156994 RepID=UPI001C08CBB9|nr:hypothetical protein [Reichenbachiella agariperforans]MBU2884162.1 hypothetical protein [Gilvimarinus agarilyticus]MBU2912815.1 hypothetical protein [Reichenbachiella agariperforans]
MSKERSDSLFLLIKSLKKSEKRYFNLSNSGTENAKYTHLFSVIDKQKKFDDDEILIKAPIIKAQQLSNLKAHLYTKVLESLRDYNSSTLPNIRIRDMVDHAEILFNKSLYTQCAEVIKKAKKMAIKSDNLEMQLEILKWEKQMLTRHTVRDSLERTNKVIREIEETTTRINHINSFSNLQFKLQAMYKKIGFIRNESDYKDINQVFNSNLPLFNESTFSVSEKISLYTLYIGYYFFIQDFKKGYQYAKRLVELFSGQKTLIQSRLEAYISSLNYLLIAQNKLLKYREFQNTTRELRALYTLPSAHLNENIKLKLQKYTFVHEFNRLFMKGDFRRGVNLIERIMPGIEPFALQLDPHSRVIMYFKTACLYFGNDDHKTAIIWLNKIINSHEVDLREDIHGFARIVNLISHYELGNMELIEYYVRSTYRFLLKKEDLHQFQKYILNFLVRLKTNITEKELEKRFETLRNNLLLLSKDPYEKRAFLYFDIISWLESKIEKRPVQDIIQEKAAVRLTNA